MVTHLWRINLREHHQKCLSVFYISVESSMGWALVVTLDVIGSLSYWAFISLFRSFGQPLQVHSGSCMYVFLISIFIYRSSFIDYCKCCTVCVQYYAPLYEHKWILNSLKVPCTFFSLFCKQTNIHCFSESDYENCLLFLFNVFINVLFSFLINIFTCNSLRKLNKSLFTKKDIRSFFSLHFFWGKNMLK